MYSLRLRSTAFSQTVLICFLSIAKCHILRLECKGFANFSRVMQGYMLKGYTVAEYGHLHLEECFGYCLNNPSCKSVNFKIDGSGKCQLTSKVAGAKGGFLLHISSLWNYYMTSYFNHLIGENCMAKDPCGAEKICMDTCSCPGYRCIDCSRNTLGIICCQRKIAGKSGTLSSPNYPDLYQPLLDCYWTISVTPGKKIKVHFESFDLEESRDCKFDYVTIKDGPANATSLLVDKACKLIQLQSLMSSGSTIHIIFKTDHLIEKKGFELKWSEG